MIRPPIVGVPGLGVVLLRPVLADVLAELAHPQVFDEFRAEEDADQHRRHPGDQDFAHQPISSASTLGDALQADRARALDEDRVAGLQLGGQQLGRLARVGDELVGVVVAGRQRRRRSRRSTPAARACSPTSRWKLRRRRGRARPSRRARRPCAAPRGSRDGRAPRASTPGWRCSSRSRGRSRRRARGARHGSGRILCPQRGRPSPPGSAPSATPAAIAASALVEVVGLGEGEVEALARRAGCEISASVTPSATRDLGRLDVAAGAEAQQARRPLQVRLQLRPPRPGRPRCRRRAGRRAPRPWPRRSPRPSRAARRGPGRRW